MKKDMNTRRYGAIRSWKLVNFKSVQNASVELAPLTIIVGKNSSGKSSLIQSILLMAQNAREGMNRETSRRKIDLNGALVNLGTFNEIVSDNAKEQKIEISGEVRVEELERRALFGKLRPYGRPTPDRTGKPKDESLDWKMELRSSSKDENSGFANVLKSSATYKIEGTAVESLSAGEVSEFESTEQFKYENYDFESKGILETVRQFEDEYNFVKGPLSLQAVSYKMGIPFSGLVSTTRLEDFMNKHARLWGEDLRQNVIREIQFRRPSAGMRHNSKSDYESRLELPVFESFQIASDEYVAKAIEIFRSLEKGDISLWEEFSDDPTFLINFGSIPFYVEITEANEDGAHQIKIPLSDIGKHLEDLPNGPESSRQVWEQAQEFWEKLQPRLVAELSAISSSGGACLVLPEDRDRSVRSRRRLEDEPFKTSWAVTNFQRVLMSLVYLGPLREAPKHLYDRDSSIPYPQLPLGRKGELLAKRLFDNEVREYPLPNGELSKLSEKIGLRDAVNKWLLHLGLASTTGVEVKIEDLYGYRLRVDGRGLPAMGTGVSQVLPVIALCLMLPKGGIALFEEPELHLNPGIQQKLADFFLEICKSDRQIIAETHSEYIVTRLRRRASESNENSGIFTFVFTELDDVSGTSYRSVAPDDQGMINNWPAGFFDQVSGDVRALLLNTAEKREKAVLEEE
jgi:predicted ATPase